MTNDPVEADRMTNIFLANYSPKFDFFKVVPPDENVTINKSPYSGSTILVIPKHENSSGMV